MELRQIQYFIEVAKREHVTEAAHAMHIAQSAVSRQIFNLESELGVQLFIREGRNVKLTPIGRVFLEYMKEAVQVIDSAKREVEEFLDPERGTIRIGFPSSLANYTLPTDRWTKQMTTMLVSEKRLALKSFLDKKLNILGMRYNRKAKRKN